MLGFRLSMRGLACRLGTVLNILRLLRNEGFPSLCLRVSLFCVSSDGHSRKGWIFLTLDVCAWEERAEHSLGWSLSLRFPVTVD